MKKAELIQLIKEEIKSSKILEEKNNKAKNIINNISILFEKAKQDFK